MRVLAVGLLAATALGLAACGGGAETKTVIKTVAATTPDSATTETTSSEPPSCEELADSGGEGLCVEEGGSRVKIANRDTTLVLPELSARYLGYRTAKTLTSSVDTQTAEGRFVIIRVRITNKTSSPEVFKDAKSTALHLGGARYTTHFDAENMPGDSFVWNDDPIQPGNSRTGTIIFDVPARRVAKMEEDGNLLIAQFSDKARDGSTMALGLIRTYGG